MRQLLLLTFETSGSLQAQSVSLVVAGNVNSGQLATRVRLPLSLLLRWVNAYIRKRSALTSAAPGLGEGI